METVTTGILKAIPRKGIQKQGWSDGSGSKLLCRASPSSSLQHPCRMCESKALRRGPLFLVLGRQRQEDLWSWLASQSSLSANFSERLCLEKYDGKAMEEDSKQRLWPPHVHTKIHKHPPHTHIHTPPPPLPPCPTKSDRI